jgi:hypothetical protein
MLRRTVSKQGYGEKELFVFKEVSGLKILIPIVCGKYSSEDTSMKQVANILRR